MELPPDILEPLMEARFNWERKDWAICPRAMLEIDFTLDALNEYLENLRQFEEWIEN